MNSEGKHTFILDPIQTSDRRSRALLNQDTKDKSITDLNTTILRGLLQGPNGLAFVNIHLGPSVIKHTLDEFQLKGLRWNLAVGLWAVRDASNCTEWQHTHYTNVIRKTSKAFCINTTHELLLYVFHPNSYFSWFYYSSAYIYIKVLRQMVGTGF